MESGLQASVSVLCRDNPLEPRETLESLKAAGSPSRIEVMVVDGSLGQACCEGDSFRLTGSTTP